RQRFAGGSVLINPSVRLSSHKTFPGSCRSQAALKCRNRTKVRPTKQGKMAALAKLLAFSYFLS
ncbi:MAG: hypothetical protein L0Z48_05565, partial [candidate division Zixibacteria bacterium]|nr:hypothetical protein [candidate division Zixibacteria bacterium]